MPTLLQVADTHAFHKGGSALTWKVIPKDCIEWMKTEPDNSYHAVITDPPYGLKEYSVVELEKMRNGSGGVWRIPPKIGGSTRRPLLGSRSFPNETSTFCKHSSWIGGKARSA